jgi:hypothetical protein
MSEPAGGADGAGAGADDRPLEELSSLELHDRAVHHAERHLNLRFLWSLLQAVPAAEAARGDVGEAEYDIQFSKGLISDALRSDEGTAEALRPLFIEYLRKHPDA